MDRTKPFPISKRQVWEAWKKVKANQGGAGVDGQTIEAFEAKVGDNLYKLWNRMASGSYHPPPVRRVEIPKADGGVRPLGVPTVEDRVAQTVVKEVLEPELEKHFHPDSYGYEECALWRFPSACGWLSSAGYRLAPLSDRAEWRILRPDWYVTRT